MAGFPLFKLGYLAIKQISKPLANHIKRQAKSSPIFRKYICIPPAQFYHWFEVNFRMRLMGLGTAENVVKLSEKDAIELGGEMLGEFLVFSFASLVLFAEYQRGARKEAAKEEKLKQEKLDIINRIKELETNKETHKVQIKELQQQLDELFSYKENKTETQKSRSIFRIF
ncbi:unnamed protein product [Candidula unifasciata]|uniref:OPA3-like protein n=1 Tax=Candidula unifasciata TaxID=100452 RepID=A0A8S3ZYX7_9EUPU|nr:unnamed protein product [Candidula unifasciata]